LPSERYLLLCDLPIEGAVRDVNGISTCKV